MSHFDGNKVNQERIIVSSSACAAKQLRQQRWGSTESVPGCGLRLLPHVVESATFLLTYCPARQYACHEVSQPTPRALLYSCYASVVLLLDDAPQCWN